ncbi:hypothetical protein Pint_22387 [Pistacia integerrima]|uniref:Uncharacterized protein n=1 Tax=Pistacia integerrima TaxID=434235 RepID=A0ACC0YLX0_9ROSI|nr:hypothetical protein Pint_22387 [Pistacia integerrima]
MPPVLNSYSDKDSRVRYYACEALYNIAKVVRGDFIIFFNQIFDALCKLSADSDANVQSAAHLLDRLVKDIVTESDQFSVPDIDMLGFLPDFLDGLFNMFSDSSHEIRQQTDSVLSKFLQDIKNSPSVDYGRMAEILVQRAASPDEFTRLMAIIWINEALNILVQQRTSPEIGDSYIIDVEPNNSNIVHRTHCGTYSWSRKVSLEWIFVITNFVLEVPSAVLDQLSSTHKAQYELFAMLLSFVALFICITELIYKGQKGQFIWRWLPWFYNASQNYKPFGSFKDFVGSVCALCQCIVTAINYAQTDDKLIDISSWPIIFAFGLLYSKILENRDERRNE